MNSGHRPDIQYFINENMKEFPFSEAVRVENVLYLSGQIGIDSSMKLVPGGIAAETQKAMENIKGTLERCGSSLDHVIKVTVMLADISEWGAMNDVYVKFFSKNKPARSSFAATGLAMGARVEIECMAVRK
jgi:reactive intermediate/imine deaminase